jgi:hypothetical protein
MRIPLTLITWAALGAFTAILIAQQRSSPEGRQPAPTAAPDPRIVVLLQEIVAIRERQVQNHQLLRDAGRASVDSAPEVELIEARIRLALELRQTQTVRAELSQLVAAQEQRLKRVESVARDWRSADVDAARVDLLDARIRQMRDDESLSRGH